MFVGLCAAVKIPKTSFEPRSTSNSWLKRAVYECVKSLKLLEDLLNSLDCKAVSSQEIVCSRLSDRALEDEFGGGASKVSRDSRVIVSESI